MKGVSCRPHAILVLESEIIILGLENENALEEEVDHVEE